jgi:hypothetical protein
MISPSDCPHPDLLCNECDVAHQCGDGSPTKAVVPKTDVEPIQAKPRGKGVWKKVPPGMSRSVAKSLGLI